VLLYVHVINYVIIISKTGPAFTKERNLEIFLARMSTCENLPQRTLYECEPGYLPKLALACSQLSLVKVIIIINCGKCF